MLRLLKRFANAANQTSTEHLKKRPETEDNAPLTQHHRDIRYYQLSDIADVWISERPDGKIFW
jgi:hypothetical protein